MSDTWREKIRELAEDHRSPSSALASRAADLLQDVAQEEPALLAEAARGVVLAQPSMAALASVANVVLRAVETLGLSSVPRTLEALQKGMAADRHAAAQELCERVGSPVRVVSTSASAAVVVAIQALSRNDLLTGVVCGESRPLLEGTALARWLVEQGYDTTLVTDAGLCDHIGPGSILVVGTDAILPRHVVNKMGTRVYATWARLSGVPSYVLASRDKVYPPGLQPCFENPVRPADELAQHPPAAMHVDNRAIDLTERRVWTDVLVGGIPVEVAESRGDHALAQGLRQLVPTES
ncbi:MAG: hypothetical protein ACE5G2_13580 [Candidatus Krumholzibacteriia bacterium]